MYYFEAHYFNIEDEIEFIRHIKFDGQFFDNEKACYIYAMTKAYEMQEKGECLVSVEFIAC